MNNEQIERLVTAASHYHEGRDEVSSEEYRLRNRVQLAMQVQTKLRLYLDTNYWLRLRDCVLEKARSAEDSELLNRLRRSVAKENLIVPATEHIVAETLRQRDRKTRAVTAHLIQEMSSNVALVGFINRAVREFIGWVHSFSDASVENELDAGVLVWSWPRNLYGEVVPSVTSADPIFSNRMEKIAEDLAAVLPFAERILRLPVDKAAQASPLHVAAQLNTLKSESWHSSQPFPEVLLDESVGFINSIWADLCKHASEWIDRMPLLKGDENEGQLKEHLKRLVVSSIRLKQFGSMMPAMQILAGGNAAIRTSKGRKFKPGDHQDLFHATAALPYCSIFATDRSNKHLLTTPPLDLGRKFSCRIVSSVDELLEVIEHGS